MKSARNKCYPSERLSSNEESAGNSFYPSERLFSNKESAQLQPNKPEENVSITTSSSPEKSQFDYYCSFEGYGVGSIEYHQAEMC